MTGYVFNSEGYGAFDPDGRVAIAEKEINAHDRALEQAELDAWRDKPARAVAYITKDGQGRWQATTWLGTRLGDVIRRNVYRHNFGCRFESVVVQGSNGVRYRGRKSADWSQLIHLRAMA
jgi:hypothetical protein